MNEPLPPTLKWFEDVLEPSRVYIVQGQEVRVRETQSNKSYERIWQQWGSLCKLWHKAYDS